MGLGPTVRPRKLSSLAAVSAAAPVWTVLKTPSGMGAPGLWPDSGPLFGERICEPVPDDDALGLGLGTVAAVAHHVDGVGPGVQDGGTAVVAAVGVGLGELGVPVLVHLGDGPVRGRRAVGVGEVDGTRCVGVRHVEGARRGDIAHEVEVLVVCGVVQRQLRLRREARGHLVAARRDAGHRAVGNFDPGSPACPRS